MVDTKSRLSKSAQPQQQKTRHSRIPQTLQAVFLASNRGRDVHKPPPDRVAFRVFFRNWVFQKKTGSKNLCDESTGKSSSDPCLANDVSVNDFPPPLKTQRRHASMSDAVSSQKKNKHEKSKESSSSLKRSSRECKTKTAVPTPSLSPQAYLDAMITSRGYSTQRFETLQTAYHNKPTVLQTASYDVFLIDLVRKYDKEKLRDIMNSGISTNPCNIHGESLVHSICRRGDAIMLQVMLDAGCTIQVADDYGRTPLHDACWAAKPCFDVVEIILNVDRRMLFLSDCRGAVPLAYARKHHWSLWLEFLASKNNVYWPIRNAKALGAEEPPELALLPPNSRPIPDPKDSLSPEIANMVASGKMETFEAEYLRYKVDEDVTCGVSSDDSSDTDEDEDDSDDDDSDYDSDDDADEDEDWIFDKEEMAELLSRLSKPQKVCVVIAN